MAIVPTILNNIRLVGQDSDFLDRKAGLRGEIYYDRDIRSLRIYPGDLQGGLALARADQTAKIDLTNVPNQTFKDKATAAGISASTTVSADPPSSPNAGELWFDTDTAILYLRYNDGNTTQWVQPANVQLGGGSGGGSGNSFTTIAVSGQSSVVADTSSDTLTLVAGSNIVISTDPSTDAITISATSVGGASASFGTIAVSGQSSIVAPAGGSTLTYQSGTGISITTDAVNNIVTFTNTQSAPTFATLTDATSASMTIDKIYLPAITKLAVDNSGTTAYIFDQYSGTNPTVYAISGTTIAFDLSAAGGHPFQIQDPTGTNYNTGLIHVSTSGTVSTGTNAQGKDSGTLYWKIPQGISGNYRYQCSVHAAMVGIITVKNIQAL